MIDGLIQVLQQKGYRLMLRQNEYFAFIREAAEKNYVIVLNYNCVDYESLQQIKQQIRYKAVTQFQKSIEMLNIILAKDGMFEERLMSYINQVSDTWIIAQDTAKLYVFEQQPNEFDDLRDLVEMCCHNRVTKKKDKIYIRPVTLGILICNLVYFFVVMAKNKDIFAVYQSDVMLNMGALSYDMVKSGQWYRLLSSIFMHFGISHLFNNMLLLVYLGNVLEEKIGRFAYLFLYLVCGVMGNIVSLQYYHMIGEDAVSAGASGAIFGIIGILFMVLLLQGNKKSDLSARQIGIMALFTIYYGLTTIGVDNAAHIGGLISGIIGGFLLSKISQYDKLEEAKTMR